MIPANIRNYHPVPDVDHAAHECSILVLSDLEGLTFEITSWMSQTHDSITKLILKQQEDESHCECMIIDCNEIGATILKYQYLVV